MKTIYKYKVFPNGDVHFYHQVHEVIFPKEEGFITLVVASWQDDPGDRVTPMPDKTSQITMLMDTSLEDFINLSTEKLMELPEWNGMLFDSNIPGLVEAEVVVPIAPTIYTPQEQIFPTAASGRIPVVYPI